MEFDTGTVCYKGSKGFDYRTLGRGKHIENLADYKYIQCDYIMIQQQGNYYVTIDTLFPKYLIR